jgi:hypothetical protein
MHGSTYLYRGRTVKEFGRGARLDVRVQPLRDPNATKVARLLNDERYSTSRAAFEASFTSYGKVDIWAHGVGVPTRTPGGEIVPMSGASLATPQVVNLSDKVLALRPQLSMAELRSAIFGPADESDARGPDTPPPEPQGRPSPEPQGRPGSGWSDDSAL